MNIRSGQCVCARPVRSGFTLVELLVVIAIIGILVTIAIAAMAPLVENARIAATKTTINQLSAMVQQRMDALMESDELENEIAKFTSVGISEDAAGAMARMHLYRSYFPQRLSDMYGYDGNPDTSDDSPLYKKMRSGTGWAPGSWGDLNQSPKVPERADAAESSELLYLFLSSGTVGGMESALEIDQINPKHIGDTDEDGNLEFIDSWGNPIQFYNWPTVLFATSAVRDALVSADTVALQNVDPFDPTGAISLNGFGSSSNSLLQNAGFQPFNQGEYKYPDQYWAFMIISAGPDEVIGLGNPNSGTVDERLGQVVDLDSVYDNITNRQQ